MLFSPPRLTRADHRVLAEIDDYFTSFRQATGAGRAREWVGGLRRRLIADAIRGSNSIEGFVVDENAASAIVADAPVSADVPVSSREAVRGYRDALTWVLNTDEMPFFAYSETMLSMLHFMMIRSQRDRSPGRYRKAGIIVTSGASVTPAYVGPPADEVAGLMAELVAWLNDGDLDAHLLVRGAMAHLNLVSIHPWRDGNGRMSRCLQTLVIARGGWHGAEFCSIEEWLGYEIHTLEYYQALSTARKTYEPERDIHDWVRFCLRAHHLQAQAVDRRLTHARVVWERIEELVARLGLSERVVSALDAAATDQLRREVYQRDEGLSRDQAIRDIRRLEQAGLIEAVGYGPTLYYVAIGDAKQIADEVTESVTAPAREPYE